MAEKNSKKRVSRKAIIAAICGATMLPCAFAVGFGHKALNEIESDSDLEGTGLAYVGIGLGYLSFFTIIGLLFFGPFLDFIPNSIFSKGSDEDSLESSVGEVVVEESEFSGIQNILIKRNAYWKYRRVDKDIGEDWKSINFNSNKWEIGQALIGFGQGLETTNIEDADDSGSTAIRSCYFRKAFNVYNLEGLKNEKLMMWILYDDGAVIYLNGKEFKRLNMPEEGEIRFDTLALSEAGPDSFEFIQDEAKIFPVDPSFLHDGTNHIAIEVHPFEAGDPDLIFGLSLVVGDDYF